MKAEHNDLVEMDLSIKATSMRNHFNVFLLLLTTFIFTVRSFSRELSSHDNVKTTQINPPFQSCHIGTSSQAQS